MHLPLLPRFARARCLWVLALFSLLPLLGACAVGSLGKSKFGAAPAKASPPQAEAARPVADAPPTASGERYTPIELSLYGGASLSAWANPKKTVLGVDVNVLYSHADRLWGVGVGMFAELDRDLLGLQLNVFGNLVGGSARGLQLSPFYNRVVGDFLGLQLTAGKNVLKGYTATGIQLAGLKNETLADFTGLQLAAIVNEASGFEYAGLQVAAGFNWSDAELFTGGQVSAFFNTHHGDFTGVQVGLVNNVSASEKRDEFFRSQGQLIGMQVGLINIGGWVRGAQVGLVNYAAALTGLQVGLINIAKRGALPFMLGANLGFASEKP